MAIGGYARGFVRGGLAFVVCVTLMAPLHWASGPAAAMPLSRSTETIPVDPYAGIGSVRSLPFSQAVPAFPTSVPGYRLKGKKQRSEVRLFEGAKWEALPPMDQGMAGHCDIAIWVVRWRSRNPNVIVAAALGDTAFPGFNRIGKPSTGGAGYITGNACVSPGLKIWADPGHEGDILIDVDYEYQIWFPKRKI